MGSFFFGIIPLTKHSHKRGVSPRRHPTVVVKVNAPVDRGIAPLVMALSELPELLTIDSCQGGNGLPAYVYLRYSGQFIYRGADEDELRVFSRLAKALAAKCQDGGLYALCLEWCSGDAPLGHLKCAPKDVPRLAKLVHSVASDYHARGLLCDRQRKVLRS